MTSPINKVNFNNFQTESSIMSQIRKTNNAKLNAFRPKTAVVPKNPTKPRGIRPLTAKSYYSQNISRLRQRNVHNLNQGLKSQNDHKVYERIIDYNLQHFA